MLAGLVHSFFLPFFLYSFIQKCKDEVSVEAVAAISAEHGSGAQWASQATMDRLYERAIAFVEVRVSQFGCGWT